MTNEIFKSAISGVMNAKRHFRALEVEIVAFNDSNPFEGFIEYSPDGQEEFHKVRISKPIPHCLPDMVFDVVSNLRASLDRASNAISVAVNSNARDTHFPFGDNLKAAQSRQKGKSKDVPSNIFNLMIAYAPYRDGNGLLWALNKLCNANKHETIHPVAMTVGDMRAQNAYGNPTNVIFNHFLSYRWPPVWDSAKNEMIIFHLPRRVLPNAIVDISTFIVMTNVEVIEGQSVLGVLSEMIRLVETILAGIETEARSKRQIA